MAAISRQQSDAEVNLMKAVPARYITSDWRRKLSVVMDGRCDVADRDYRYFAERNGLLPEIWQWLDAQKIEGDTSSFCKVLKHLIDQHGNSFTVFHVYNTFCDMGSAAIEVLWNAWPDIKKTYFAVESRPGQENAEEFRCQCTRCVPNRESVVTHPSSDVDTEHSVTVEHVEAAHNSNLKCSNPSQFGSNNLSMDPFSKWGGTYNSLSLVEGKSGPHSSSLSKAKMSIGLPLNIEQKRHQSDCAFQSHVTTGCSSWPGRVYKQQNSKQYFQSYQYAHCGNSVASNPIWHRPACDITCYDRVEEQPHQLVHDPPSYQLPCSAREKEFSSGCPWDGNYHNTEVKSLNSNTEGSRYQSVSKTQKKQNSSQRVQSFEEGNINPGPLQASSQPRHNSMAVPLAPDAANHFVLIISGDTDQKAASCRQVQHFCQVLKEFSVPHVAIVPTMEYPIFWLTDKQRKELILPNQTRAVFLKNCYQKAKKIVIAVSPSFVRYSDSNSSGNTPANEKWQPFIQWLFKEMYAEHVDERRKTHRLWPVLLTTMDTDRQHIPWFLSQVLYYYFPKKQGSEDVADLLQTEVHTRTSEK